MFSNQVVRNPPKQKALEPSDDLQNENQLTTHEETLRFSLKKVFTTNGRKSVSKLRYILLSFAGTTTWA